MTDALHAATHRPTLAGHEIGRRSETTIRSGPSTYRSFTADFAETLEAAKLGDGRAFARIDAELSGRILAFVASRGVEDPGGVTNEVFLGVFRSIDTFSGNEAAFTGWVFRIARNKIIDEHRYLNRRPQGLVPLEAAGDVTMSESAEDSVLGDVTLTEVYKLLDCLTEEQREIVLMRAVASLTFPEIAKALNKRVGAVKASYRRAIKTANRIAALRAAI